MAPAGRFFLPPAVPARRVERLAAVLDAAMTRLPVEAATALPEPVRTVARVLAGPSRGWWRRARWRSWTVARCSTTCGTGPARCSNGAAGSAGVLRREGDAAAAALGEVVHWRGKQATFRALASAVAAPPAVLHISAHAVDCPGFPSQSLLLLGDGPVAMAAFAELRLQGTAVVLSACGAGAGEQRGQEGNVGLVEGAFSAGARAVVAPIAEVNQQATADLMAQFHHRLAAGQDVAEAMAAARSVLAAAPQYTHPHYWATFAVHGHGGSTTAATASACRWRWPWLLVLLAVAPVWSWWRRWRARSVGAGDQFHGRIV
ncbi:MAG: CHAT domain-containing protein [Planctomycetes bacterium]|nr:CHAT domain-containing protein [Planctomycetota bacterium]